MSRPSVVLGALVLLGALAVVVTAASLGTRGGRGTAAGSSFRADETGLLGARRLLEELGHRVESRRGPKLPAGTGHLLLRVEGIEEHGLFSAGTPQDEAIAAGADLDRWVQAGNSVLLAGSRTPPGTSWPPIGPRRAVAVAEPAVKPESGDGEEEEEEEEDEDETARNEGRKSLSEMFGALRPKLDDADGRDVEEVSHLDGPGDPWISQMYRIAPPRGALVLCEAPADDGDPVPVVVEVRRGQGRVVLVADPHFLANTRLAKTDNAAWLAVLAMRLASGGDVFIDDRAVGEAATRGVLSLFSEAGLGAALIAGAVLLATWWWRAAPSDAPDRRVREEAVYRPETFALLRAELYAKCLNAREARRIVRDEVARRLGRGDAVGCDRALAMLASRDPSRAERIRAALEALPDDASAPSRRPQAWCEAVAAVGRAIAINTKEPA